MKVLKVFGHITLTGLALVLFVLLPEEHYLGLLSSAGGETDVVSSASVALPDQPSGEFLVLLNTGLHEDSLEDWRIFLGDPEELPIIWEDVSCLVAEGDSAGMELAERLQAELSENQLSIRTENATLLASKAESGLADMVIFSEEMAEAVGLSAETAGQAMTVFTVSGGEEQNETD